MSQTGVPQHPGTFATLVGPQAPALTDCPWATENRITRTAAMKRRFIMTSIRRGRERHWKWIITPLVRMGLNKKENEMSMSIEFWRTLRGLNVYTKLLKVGWGLLLWNSENKVAYWVRNFPLSNLVVSESRYSYTPLAYTFSENLITRLHTKYCGNPSTYLQKPLVGKSGCLGRTVEER